MIDEEQADEWVGIGLRLGLNVGRQDDECDRLVKLHYTSRHLNY